MPGRDQTGPLGAGPMTGRGAGLCAGSNTPGISNSKQGRGFGRGCGRGRRQGLYGLGRGFRGGWGNPRSVTADPTQERDLLQREQSRLSSELKQIQQRLDALEE